MYLTYFTELLKILCIYMFRKLFNFYSNACKSAQYIIIMLVLNYVMIRYLSFKVGDNRSSLIMNIISSIMLFLFIDFLCEKGLSFIVWIGVFILAVCTLLIFIVFSTYLFSNKENQKLILQQIFGKKYLVKNQNN